MRLPPLLSRRGLAAAVLTALAAFAPAVPIHAQSLSDYDADITVDIDPPGAYRPCPMTLDFTATVTAKDPEPGMKSFPVTYHWERKGKRGPDHTFTVAATGQVNDDYVLHDVTAPFRGYLSFVITKPWHYTKTTGDMDIICH